MSSFTTRPEILGTFGVVTSTHWLASQAGMAVLEKGGNAFDAAVAVGFTLNVVEPHLNGPAGEVPIIIAPAGGDVRVVCGQGVAPGAATLAAFEGLGLDMVPGTGLLAAVVPGAFDAWMVLLRDYGTMALADVMGYAIGYARNGYPLVANISLAIDSMAAMFESEWTTSAGIYLAGGRAPQPGTLFTNPQLADSFERIVREAETAPGGREGQIEAARRIWREGFIAEAIDDFCRETEVMDSSGRRHRGLLTGDDMARWQATYEPPLTYDYHGYRLFKTGPWGQGPVFLQQLALLDGFDFSGLDERDPDFVHILVEAAKLAFADREAYYGDPDFVVVPMEGLLSAEYNATRRQLISPDRASMDLRPGALPGFDAKVTIRPMEASAGVAGLGEPTVATYGDGPTTDAGIQKGDTCHFDIIDRWGNMVTATPSGGWLQSSPAVPGLGFCLGSRGQMFWLDADAPGRLEPGKRPRTTLSTSLCARDGIPYMAFGTPGGDQQDQWALHLFLRHVHFGLNLQQAIDAPGFFTSHFPSSFYPRQMDPGRLALEGRFPAATIDELRRRGHLVSVEDDWSIGRMCAAAREGGLLKAGANPRFMQGYAVGR